MNRYIIGILIFIIGIFVFILLQKNLLIPIRTSPSTTSSLESPYENFPLAISNMRKQQYPGSAITIEQTLPPGSNYDRYVVSYLSEKLKIFALLTIPQGQRPSTGWPVIIFNHGYIPPDEYQTTQKYLAYTDAFSRNGYIVFKSDYRGHGDSEGNPEGGYYSPAYTIDVLNGLASIKKMTDLSSGKELLVDPHRIGMWGHSMGGNITLRSMVVTKDIKAGVIWAGVVADYKDLATSWRRNRPFVPSTREQMTRRTGRQTLIATYGDFDKNPAFWQAIAPINFVVDISGPIQLHHGTADEEVPVLFSERLRDAMQKANKTVQFYSYEGADHNISQDLGVALERSLEFFDTYVKN